jgi:predicted transcriptional regulator
VRPEGTRPSPNLDLVVVARFLEALWRHGNRMRRTQLQMAARVNYEIFVRYLSHLEERGLARRTNGPDGDWEELTAKGYEAHRFLAEGLAGLFRGRPGGRL